MIVSRETVGRSRRGCPFRALFPRLLCLAILMGCPTVALAGGPPADDARAFILKALSNQKVAYSAERTSCVWSDSGTRALIAHVYKDGNNIRYEYPARGNQPGHVVIETDKTVYFIRPDARRVIVSRRPSDPDVDGGIRLQLALKNYLWRFEPSRSSRRRVVVAYHNGSLYPTQRFWVLVPQMVVVRSLRYGPQNEVRSSWSLGEIHFEPKLSESYFEPTLDATVEQHEIAMPLRVDPANIEPTVGFRPVPLPSQALPPGYEVVEVVLEQMKNQKALRMVYSDGLESFSLLESAVKPRTTVAITDARRIQILDLPAQVATSVEANVVHWQDEQISFSLVGTQPAAHLVSLSRALIASQHPPEQAPPPPRRSFGEIIARGWERLMRILGLS